MCADCSRSAFPALVAEQVDRRLAHMNRIAIVAVVAPLLATTVLGCKPKLYKAGSSSMSPTITNGDFVVADLSAFSRSAPARWDVVVFHPPVAASGGVSLTQVWVMRVVGLPGETVSCATGGITVNGQPLSPPARLTNINYKALDKLRWSAGVTSPFVVPSASYFVLGDNSTNANDSRYWGALPRSNILERVLKK
jgi:signal peptidase I